jgi:copper chaperone NosL
MTRPLVVLALVGLALLGAVLFLWPVPPAGSEPIVYGRDICAHCRMHLSRPGFAAERRDRAGVLAKYDDLGCMVRAMLDDAEPPNAMEDAWVEDHGDGGLIPLRGAVLVRIAGSETPMGSGLIAFAADETAQAFAAAQGGRVVSSEAVLGEARAERAHERKDDQP